MKIFLYTFALIFIFVGSANGQTPRKLSPEDFNLANNESSALLARIRELEKQIQRLSIQRVIERAEQRTANRGWWYDGNTNRWHRYRSTQSAATFPTYQPSFPIQHFGVTPFFGNGFRGGSGANCSGGT
jgi:hypothetical protein